MMMNASRIFIRRLAAPSMTTKLINLRPMGAAFSTECAPAQKVRTVLEEYRVNK